MEPGIHELTAGYALDALDADERAAFEAHLPGCERCQEELESFWETAEALAVATVGPVPPPALRERILDAARAERQTVVPLTPRRSRWTPVLGAAAAAAAVAVIGLGLYAVSLSSDLDETRTALAETEKTQAVLADPASQTVALQAGDGQLVVGSDGDAVLVLDMVDPVPSGKTYEVWIIEGDAPKPAGLFPGEDGQDVVLVDGTVKPGAVVAVTVEDAGGVDAPTTTPVVASQPV
jgi:anti-sigma-K factor RskA